jgi:hypothetical protein
MRTALIRSLVAGTIAATGLLLMGATATAAPSAPKEHDPVMSSASGDIGILVTKLTHSQATSRLSSSGITWSSSGNCSNRNNSTCTSFDQVNLATIQGAQTLRSASGCGINITGGTEVGHASGTYSHYNGYKLDMGLTSCLTGYIQRNFTSIGGSKWQSGAGNIYYLEGNHWDVTFYNCGGC